MPCRFQANRELPWDGDKNIAQLLESGTVVVDRERGFDYLPFLIHHRKDVLAFGDIDATIVPGGLLVMRIEAGRPHSSTRPSALCVMRGLAATCLFETSRRAEATG